MSGITAVHLNKSFEGKTVLRDVSLTLPEGSVTCITGPSGCGKTTLLRLLAGLETPDAGVIRGVPEDIAFVFQEDRLCEDFRAASNVRLATGRRVPGAEILRQLREVGLGDAMDLPVRAYSGGMKRRVAIVRAVCRNAPLLLMDEPFKGLDVKLRNEVIAYVKRYSAGKTLVCVTHDPEEAALMGGRVMEMEAEP